jgi:hypothetical protein
MATQLSEKAKEHLQRIAESRKNDSKFVRIEPGEKTTLHFDPERIEPVDVEFEGKKRHQISVYCDGSKRTRKIEVLYSEQEKFNANRYILNRRPKHSKNS